MTTPTLILHIVTSSLIGMIFSSTTHYGTVVMSMLRQRLPRRIRAQEIKGITMGLTIKVIIMAVNIVLMEQELVDTTLVMDMTRAGILVGDMGILGAIVMV